MNELPSPQLISREAFVAQDLIHQYPPRLGHENKVIVFEIASPPGAVHRGQLTFSRWAAGDIPKLVSRPEVQTDCEARTGFFAYEPSADDNVVEWYLNFAHFDLFRCYGTRLFAQDEMQVAEHPALGSLREALLDLDLTPLTVEAGTPTPVLIMGVERRCAIATDRNPAEGRPWGLYGNHFAAATREAIVRAVKVLDPPTVTNLIAIEAPSFGEGEYTEEQIEFILATALTGFSAAVTESRRNLPDSKVVVHTGFWGCGAYGGNRVLMATLQVIAAQLSGLDRLIFHLSDQAGLDAWETAQKLAEEVLQSAVPRASSGLAQRFGFRPADTAATGVIDLLAMIRDIESRKFVWGVSDGN